MDIITLAGFYRGDDHSIGLHFQNHDTAEPIDITGWQFVSTLKLSMAMADSGNLQVRYTVPEEVDSSLKGNAILNFPHQQTRQLIPATYWIDVQVTIGQQVRTLFVGKIPVWSDVTRSESYDAT